MTVKIIPFTRNKKKLKSSFQRKQNTIQTWSLTS